jgi:DNA-binding IclR family transcriptional regulator
MGNPRREADLFSRGITPDHPQFVSAVARAFSVLRCFEHGVHYLGNREIAKRTGLPKPTVSRFTFTLSALGYLNYSPEREKYCLGTAVLGLSHAFLRNNDVLALARPLMQSLAEQVQAAVMVAAADGLRMVLLDICQGDATFHLKLAVGARVPHGTTALGRADLAARPQAVFDARLAELERDCDPAQWPRIRAGIVQAREDYTNYGFCFSLGDWNPDVFAIGVPLVSADRSRVLAFNCSGRLATMTRERLLHEVGPRLVALRNSVFERCEGRF